MPRELPGRQDLRGLKVRKERKVRRGHKELRGRKEHKVCKGLLEQPVRPGR
ncbi:hypothetical protein PghCCS26_32280 [Paenibacillus glycanilyticus]|uniref:Uncharacterized protein n=1 Tax=Paenibacillus glycanilyticus TaxID=126569 RepID=A0ABQ6NLY7_9BACL|nr:hypothetical protein PghCCS26_32280 [Paenibacillus glycanilyticus]